jgi:hypothetical protein
MERIRAEQLVRVPGGTGIVLGWNEQEQKLWVETGQGVMPKFFERSQTQPIDLVAECDRMLELGWMLRRFVRKEFLAARELSEHVDVLFIVHDAVLVEEILPVERGVVATPGLPEGLREESNQEDKPGRVRRLLVSAASAVGSAENRVVVYSDTVPKEARTLQENAEQVMALLNQEAAE